MHKKFFLKVFNAALKLGHFPSAWKVSKVVLIPKKTSHGQQNIEDFRPIAINSIFAKIFEKLIYYRAYHHLAINNLLPHNQYGFTYGTSAIVASNTLKSNITDAIERGENILVISLDIKNAFGNIKYDRIRERIIEQKFPTDLKYILCHLLQDRRITYEIEPVNIEIKLLNARGATGIAIKPIFMESDHF